MQSGSNLAAEIPNKIPSLDGLRAISIAFVILGHSRATFPDDRLAWFFNIFGQSNLGVSVFFVISGFLITRLLVNEEQRFGFVSLKNFYVRRILRIFPAFYFYIIVMAILTLAGVLAIPYPNFLTASTFTLNYYTGPATWWLGHFWSLCIEEQFYILWPSVFIFTPRRHLGKVLSFTLLVSPILRVVSYFLLPDFRGYISIQIHTRLDLLSYGCLLAVYWESQSLQAVLRAAFARQLHWIFVGYLLLVAPWLTGRFHGAYVLPIGWTLQGIGISLFLAYAILHSDSLIGRFLNLHWIKRIGVLSYSLYIWQQPFLTTENATISGSFPLNIVCTFLAAWLSYRFIEKPFLRFKAHFAEGKSLRKSF